jgi:hypothetical protein
MSSLCSEGIQKSYKGHTINKDPHNLVNVTIFKVLAADLTWILN